MSTPTTPFYPMTHDDAQELIAAIGDESKLAQAYDSTRTYTKDEHCIYSGKLYKCISTISTAEAWTAAHWEEATVGDELTEHKKDIDAICQTVTGANNNTGHTINSGEYFIANGAKYKANAAIPNGEPWASSADPVSDHDLINALNGKIANIDKTFIIEGTSLTAVQNAIIAVAQTLAIGHVAVGTLYGNYSDSLTAGSRSSAIIHRHGNASYKIAILNECKSGYYYNNEWHWSKATMTSFTPT